MSAAAALPLALTLPIAGNRVIEASAGTGKTWTLSALYLRLVLGGEASGQGPLLPSQILVLTFTNAAAEELRERIRDRLALAARAFRDGEARSAAARKDIVIEHLLTSTPEAERGRSARLLALAAEDMDEAAISTIHAWALKTLQSNPFRSRIPFELEMVDAREQIERAARDYFRVYLEGLPAASYALVERALGAPDAIAGNLARLLDRPARIRGDALAPSNDPFGGVPETLEQIDAVKRAWLAQRDEALPPLLALAEAGGVARTKIDKMLQIVAAFDTWAADASPALYDGMTTSIGGDDHLWLAQATLEQRMNKGREAPRHPLFDAIGSIESWLLPKLSVPAEQVRTLRAHAWDWIGQRLASERTGAGRWSFGDLLTGLGDSLQDARSGAELAALLGEQYPVALVDEFQDTDALQYAVFSRVYLDAAGDCLPGRALLLIGDPKQAIYRFRGADLETYLHARDQAGDRCHRLDTNFRSTVELIDAVNALFGIGDHPEGPFRDARLDYAAVRANDLDTRLTRAGEMLTPLEFWRLPEPRRGADSRADFERLMAEHTAAEIADLLGAAGRGECPLQAREIAVLVSSRRQAAVVRGELARRKVASVYLSMRDSVFETWQAQDLLIILRAVAQPSDDLMVRSALATRSVGYPLGDLDGLADAEARWEEVIATFTELGAVWSARGVLPMLRRLMHRYDVFRHVHDTIDGERALTNLLHLGELLQAESREIHGREGLIRFLADAIDDAAAGAAPASDDRLQRLESDESLVRVLTVHKSKGLEFDLVYLPFGIISGRNARPAEGSIAFIHEDGELVADLAADRATLDLEQQEDHREALRLLYVAITRARHSCRVGVPECRLVGDQQDALRLALASAEDDDIDARLTALDAAAATVHLRVLDDQAPLAPLQLDRPSAALRPARSFQRVDLERHWRIASYSGLTRQEAPTRPMAVAYNRERDLEEELDAGASTGMAGGGLYGFPRGAEPGNFLHGILEWAGRLGFDQVLATPALLTDEVQRRCDRQGLGQHARALGDGLLRVLEQPVTDDGARLGALTQQQCRAEIDFLLPTLGMSTQALDALVCAHEWPGVARHGLGLQTVRGMLRGFIDLVFEHEGRYWVVDYKSNHLGQGPSHYGDEALRDEILRHRYDLQYVLYTLALHRLLATRLPQYDYDRHIGGVRYLFLRAMPDGAGVYRARPARALIERLDAEFLEAAHGTA